MIDKSAIKTVFVDIDDTVFWFTENSKLSLRHVYDMFDLGRWAASYEVFRDIYLVKNAELWNLYHYGKIDKQYLVVERFRYVLEQIGCTADMAELGDALNKEYLEFLVEQTIIVPGAKEMLEYLNSKYEVHALSNGFKSLQARKLRSVGVAHLFDKIIISDDCGITKPLRGIFDYALEQCGASGETSVMIGDNPDADIYGAKNAGWNTIYYNLRGTVPCEYADATVDNLLDVKNIL